MTEKYYEKPDDIIFNEVKSKCIEVWKEKLETGSHPEYINEKVERIENINNISDNMMGIIAMFSLDNMILLNKKLSEKANKEIAERLMDGGVTTEALIFINKW